jgi:hypothetical protein
MIIESPYHFPNHSKQTTRLSPHFDKIMEAINTLQTLPGTEPELVLVIETIDNVSDFINAVQKIEGLEWLGEIEEDDIEPEFDFYNKETKDKFLAGRLYMVMTNQKAMTTILSLWKEWETNENMKFPYGLGKFKDIFKQLHSIKQWGIKNRLEETGILDIWKLDLQDGLCPNSCEIELWYRQSAEKRKQSQNDVEKYIKNCGGQVISSCITEAIEYHALLVELPQETITKIIDDLSSVDLVKCNYIMFFRSPGQLAGFDGESHEGKSVNRVTKPLPKGMPIIALLDGYPISNHNELKERIIIDDPDDIGSAYNLELRKHGTAMASLIINGDLNDPTQKTLSTPLYIRPSMVIHDKDESFPTTCLFVDFVHRAVKRMFEGDGSTPPQAPSIKIINFSLGDIHRPFIREISPLARLLDWLSKKYNVLFIISAGNYSDNIDLKIIVENLDKDQLQQNIIQSLYANALHRRIISPSESINSITVGAAHYDASVYNERDYLYDPFKSRFLPSPISPFGAGLRRAIKPELIFPGGRTLYQRDYSSKTKISYYNYYSQPGFEVAWPSQNKIDLSYRVHIRGTSIAAALTSRGAHRCYEALQSLKLFENHENNEYTPALLKAMLIHGCEWGDAYEIIQQALENSSLDKTKLKEAIAKWVGYGLPNLMRVLNCTEERVTLVGKASIRTEEGHIFEIPIPSALEGKAIKRRLTLTLAWLSSTTPRNQKYRDSKLWFEVIGGKNHFKDVVGSTYHAVRRGTIQHEILEDSNAIVDTTDQSIKIKVNCATDARKTDEIIPYGLLATLEIAEGIGISIYEEVRTLLSTRIRIHR